MRLDVLEPIGTIIPRVLESFHALPGPDRERAKRSPAATARKRRLRNLSGPHGPPGPGKLPTRKAVHDRKV